VEKQRRVKIKKGGKVHHKGTSMGNLDGDEKTGRWEEGGGKPEQKGGLGLHSRKQGEGESTSREAIGSWAGTLWHSTSLVQTSSSLCLGRQLGKAYPTVGGKT